MLPHLLPLIGSLLLNCALVVICMLAHELGHIIVARHCNVPVKKIGFNWTGMYIQRARSTGWAEVSTCLAGAAMNMSLALLFWNVSYWFALCNLIFAVVNVLPIPNSDGTHALEAVRAMNQRSNA
jgi:membrane-associated protease RseP (regulator of RpoE activity)